MGFISSIPSLTYKLFTFEKADMATFYLYIGQNKKTLTVNFMGIFINNTLFKEVSSLCFTSILTTQKRGHKTVTDKMTSIEIGDEMLENRGSLQERNIY